MKFRKDLHIAAHLARLFISEKIADPLSAHLDKAGQANSNPGAATLEPYITALRLLAANLTATADQLDAIRKEVKKAKAPDILDSAFYTVIEPERIICGRAFPGMDGHSTLTFPNGRRYTITEEHRHSLERLDAWDDARLEKHVREECFRLTQIYGHWDQARDHERSQVGLFQDEINRRANAGKGYYDR